MAKSSGDKHGGRHQGGGGGRVFDTAKQARSEKAECEAILRVSMPKTSTHQHSSGVLLFSVSLGRDKSQQKTQQGRYGSWLEGSRQQPTGGRNTPKPPPASPHSIFSLVLLLVRLSISQNRQPSGGANMELRL